MHVCAPDSTANPFVQFTNQLKNHPINPTNLAQHTDAHSIFSIVVLN